MTRPRPAKQNLSVGIIGTGFSGLCAAIQLKKAGFSDIVVYEKGEDVGGVWRENTYPGAACDVPWHLYSFSFEYKSDWSSRYPPQPEILDYMRHCARKYDIYPLVRFNNEISDASYDDSTGLWTITTADGHHAQHRVLITGMGQLSRPAWPRIEGRDEFAGRSFHSAQWDHDYNLAGKRVAVIGTGASAIQFVPEIAPEVGQLTVFQRSAPYLLPRFNLIYGALNKFLFKHIPRYGHLFREPLHQLGDGSIGAFNGKGLAAKAFKWWTRHHLLDQVKDPELLRKLTPDYPVGCKRVLFSSDYYPALTRNNVNLVTDDITRITEHGVLTADGIEHKLDAIIYGTGFAATDFLAPMTITGKGGQDLRARWQDGAEAYLGITVDGFPNLFMCYGPNTNLGSNSIVYMIECQVNYILQCLNWLRDNGANAIEVRPDVLREYNTEIQDLLQHSVWSAGCSSWYHTADGKVTNNWPLRTSKYRTLTRHARREDFELNSVTAGEESPVRAAIPKPATP